MQCPYIGILQIGPEANFYMTAIRHNATSLRNLQKTESQWNENELPTWKPNFLPKVF